MGMLSRLLAALVVALALVLPAAAREEIRAFSANVVLATNGAVAVTETIDVQAEGNEIRRGIYRDIPVTLLGPEGGKIRPGFEVLTVTRDGAPETFRVERMGDFQRIWIGDPDVLLRNGKHRYIIDYTMTRMARTFADHDELFWNATGNYWIFPIASSVATVTLPKGAVMSSLVGYTGRPGSTEQAVTITRTSDNTAIFRTNRQLEPEEGMSFAVAFQKGILTLPTGFDAWLQWLSDLREVIFPVLAALLVLAYNFIAWFRVGRDPAKGIIIPLFYPPKDFSPGLTHYVHNWGFENSGWTAFTATIFELGVKGLLTIDNSGDDLRVTVTGKQPETPLPAGEKLVFNYFNGKGALTVDKSNGLDLQKKRGQFVAAIENENRSTWFNSNLGYSIIGYVLALALLGALVLSDILDPVWLVGSVIIGVVLGLFSTSVGSVWKGGLWRNLVTAVWVIIVGFNIFGFALDTLTHITVNTAAIAAISIVLVTVIFAVLMRAPTIQGRKIMDQIDGFKLYLNTAEKERLNITGAPPMTITRFERILPFAIALGLEKPWSEHFEGELARNAVSDVTGSGYAPLWYGGSHFGSGSGNIAGNMTNAVSAAAASMTAAMVAAQPVQASSSGFSGGGGGGSSGGGGGGGGGGGW
ncbi:DUF2207 domain-containing protein [uncultured Devosia sp.]|uniref:DUF2207 domain-containing protein n=1 Tax=uncultured Devosia sp. TaxID=211434 RepID=UPI0035CA8B29